MYGPHLKPLNTLNQTQKKGTHDTGQRKGLRRLRVWQLSAALLEAPLCDLFQTGTDTRHSLKTSQEGLSVSTQHMRCAEGLRLPP